MATNKDRNIKIPDGSEISKEVLETRTLTICNRLILIRKKFNLTQVELAELIGTSQSVVSHYENEGKVNGTVTKVLIYFFLQYNLNPLWMFAEDNSSYPVTVGSENKLSNFDYRDNLLRDTNTTLDNLQTQIEALKNKLSNS